MNRYQTRFTAPCPNNGIVISYDLTIESGSKVIMVEDILEVVKTLKGYHEQIADSLYRELGGVQTLIAHHHGVTITTLRGA